MTLPKIKTLHDIADYLEKMAVLIRSLPDVPLSNLNTYESISTTSTKKPKSQAATGLAEGDLQELADSLTDISREGAQEELDGLNLSSLRALSSLLGIRVPSRASKAETVSTLLWQLFDSPAGQERIRTFHRRHSQEF